jgi:hypothetical protein
VEGELLDGKRPSSAGGGIPNAVQQRGATRYGTVMSKVVARSYAMIPESRQRDVHYLGWNFWPLFRREWICRNYHHILAGSCHLLDPTSGYRASKVGNEQYAHALRHFTGAIELRSA